MYSAKKHPPPPAVHSASKAAPPLVVSAGLPVHVVMPDGKQLRVVLQGDPRYLRIRKVVAAVASRARLPPAGAALEYNGRLLAAGDTAADAGLQAGAVLHLRTAPTSTPPPGSPGRRPVPATWPGSSPPRGPSKGYPCSQSSAVSVHASPGRSYSPEATPTAAAAAARRQESARASRRPSPTTKHPSPMPSRPHPPRRPPPVAAVAPRAPAESAVCIWADQQQPPGAPRGGEGAPPPPSPRLPPPLGEDPTHTAAAERWHQAQLGGLSPTPAGRHARWDDHAAGDSIVASIGAHGGTVQADGSLLLALPAGSFVAVPASHGAPSAGTTPRAPPSPPAPFPASWTEQEQQQQYAGPRSAAWPAQQRRLDERRERMVRPPPEVRPADRLSPHRSRLDPARPDEGSLEARVANLQRGLDSVLHALTERAPAGGRPADHPRPLPATAAPPVLGLRSYPPGVPPPAGASAAAAACGEAPPPPPPPPPPAEQWQRAARYPPDTRSMVRAALDEDGPSWRRIAAAADQRRMAESIAAQQCSAGAAPGGGGGGWRGVSPCPPPTPNPPAASYHSAWDRAITVY
eukprot:TRINITY_DN3308_c0_g1_i1.p1 TRINITY_DN3308_c0_g1~~TRINITY_DN3308_c0_g1_i1.p1  ORF type:complete len:598 (+),score=72.95 TRINITY_DN3308_c0_g1_i1:72-1796(+)